MTGAVPTVRWSDVVYGPEGVSLDDPAEMFHEASSAYPSFAAREARGVGLLAANPELRITATRAVKRHAQAERFELPAPAQPDTPLSELVAGRRSRREFGAGAVALEDLAVLLQAGYGLTQAGRQPLRAVPSGGALYPLEVYAFAARVSGLPRGLYHFDPLAGDLEVLSHGIDEPALLDSMIFPDTVARAGVTLVITAMFWRTRFKYGLRGYRFALFEAGHLAQNVLLAATALALAAVPLGGFYDRRLAALLDVDGVNEAPLYAVCVGTRE